MYQLSAQELIMEVGQYLARAIICALVALSGCASERMVQRTIESSRDEIVGLAYDVANELKEPLVDAGSAAGREFGTKFGESFGPSFGQSFGESFGPQFGSQLAQAVEKPAAKLAEEASKHFSGELSGLLDDIAERSDGAMHRWLEEIENRIERLIKKVQDDQNDLTVAAQIEKMNGTLDGIQARMNVVETQAAGLWTRIFAFVGVLLSLVMAVLGYPKLRTLAKGEAVSSIGSAMRPASAITNGSAEASDPSGQPGAEVHVRKNPFETKKEKLRGPADDHETDLPRT